MNRITFFLFAAALCTLAACYEAESFERPIQAPRLEVSPNQSSIATRAAGSQDTLIVSAIAPEGLLYLQYFAPGATTPTSRDSLNGGFANVSRVYTVPSVASGTQLDHRFVLIDRKGQRTAPLTIRRVVQ